MAVTLESRSLLSLVKVEHRTIAASKAKNLLCQFAHRENLLCAPRPKNLIVAATAEQREPKDEDEEFCSESEEQGDSQRQSYKLSDQIGSDLVIIFTLFSESSVSDSLVLDFL